MKWHSGHIPKKVCSPRHIFQTVHSLTIYLLVIYILHGLHFECHNKDFLLDKFILENNKEIEVWNWVWNRIMPPPTYVSGEWNLSDFFLFIINSFSWWDPATRTRVLQTSNIWVISVLLSHLKLSQPGPSNRFTEFHLESHFIWSDLWTFSQFKVPTK